MSPMCPEYGVTYVSGRTTVKLIVSILVRYLSCDKCSLCAANRRRSGASAEVWAPRWLPRGLDRLVEHVEEEAAGSPESAPVDLTGAPCTPHVTESIREDRFELNIVVQALADVLRPEQYGFAMPNTPGSKDMFDTMTGNRSVETADLFQPAKRVHDSPVFIGGPWRTAADTRRHPAHHMRRRAAHPRNKRPTRSAGTAAQTA